MGTFGLYCANLVVFFTYLHCISGLFLIISFLSQIKLAIDDLKCRTNDFKVSCYSAGSIKICVIMIMFLYSDGRVEDIHIVYSFHMLIYITSLVVKLLSFLLLLGLSINPRLLITGFVKYLIQFFLPNE